MTHQHDTTFAGGIVKSVSIENLLNQRDAVIERIGNAIALLHEAQNIADAAHLTREYRGFAYLLQGKDHYMRTDLLDGDAVTRIRSRIDASAWDYLMNEAGLLSLMDSKVRADWRNKIEQCDTPELTSDNLRATFGKLHDMRADMFERGVIECFRRLSWCYQTNRLFAFGKRIVMTYIRSYGHFSLDKLDHIADLQGVFCILDGQAEEDHRNGIYRRLNDAERGRLGLITAGTHDDVYMHFRWFKNGNAHIAFKRMDLVEKMNAILAKHYPGALPHDRHTT
jgi:hypothetical protein